MLNSFFDNIIVKFAVSEIYDDSVIAKINKLEACFKQHTVHLKELENNLIEYYLYFLCENQTDEMNKKIMQEEFVKWYIERKIFIYKKYAKLLTRKKTLQTEETNEFFDLPIIKNMDGDFLKKLRCNIFY